jgi:transcriptional regulator with GAF, ATPase, and Fis domain
MMEKSHALTARGRPDRRMDEPVASSWTYDEVAAAPPEYSVDDRLVAALRAVTAALTLPRVCDAVLTEAAGLVEARAAWLVLHDQTHGVLKTCTTRGEAAAAFAGAEMPVAASTITSLAFTQREIVFVPDVAAEQRWFDAAAIRQSGLRTALAVPLIAGARVIGVLGLDAARFGPARPPTDTELKRLELLAAHAAIGIVNARLFEASQRDRARLRRLLRERRALRDEVVELRQEVRNAYSFGPIVGQSGALNAVLHDIAQVATADVTVLLLGETGTGKELVARALHEQSRRKQRPFIAVNCAALPEHLVESEMFGHEKGAFTGAVARKPGKFELAHGGTLFLDEVGDLPLAAQSKLLRVLQDGRFERVGGVSPISVDVRIIAATNHDLATSVAEKHFRDDLFYRLSVFPIRVPPLRERTGDVALLARHFGARCAERLGRRISGIEEAALARLEQYAWPGNIRELQNVIERAVLLAAGRAITADDLRLEAALVPSTHAAAGVEAAASASTADERRTAPDRDTQSPATLADAERRAILHALSKAGGRVSGANGAAALLGLRPTTLHAKMKKLGVKREDVMAPADRRPDR